jgi:hypothetical protein
MSLPRRGGENPHRIGGFFFVTHFSNRHSFLDSLYPPWVVLPGCPTRCPSRCLIRCLIPFLTMSMSLCTARRYYFFIFLFQIKLKNGVHREKPINNRVKPYNPFHHSFLKSSLISRFLISTHCTALWTG